MNSVYLRYLALEFTFLWGTSMVLGCGQIRFNQHVLYDARSGKTNSPNLFLTYKHTTPHLRPSLQQCPVFHYVRFQSWRCCETQSRPVWSCGLRSETPRCCWSHTSKWNRKACARLREEHCGLQDTDTHAQKVIVQQCLFFSHCTMHFSLHTIFTMYL